MSSNRPETEEDLGIDTPQSEPDNDSLADQAAAQLLHVLETPIAGKPSVTINDYVNARRLVKAALTVVFEKR